MKGIGFILLSLFLVSACSQQPEHPIRIGTNVWPGYEPLYLARELDSLPDDIRLVEYPSASEVIRSFRNRSLEAASLTLDEALLLKESNIPIKIVLIHDISEGADVIVAKRGIESVEQLKGKRIGVESGALGAFMITRALEVHDMSIADVEVVNLDVNLHEAAFKDGRIDAAVTFEPVRTILLNHGGNEIFTSSDIPNEIVDVMVVHANVFEENLKSIRSLIDAWFSALDYLNNNEEKAANIISERLKISSQEVLESYQGLQIPDRESNRAILSGDPSDLERSMREIQRVLEYHGLIRTGVDIDGVITDKAL
ncbi:MAG: ABC transporter substrate-binding protein [Gammaproteobacteria bacterium]|nr:ABC transporter substrate-binding protein [Gammaproteobacteria bacterium]